MRVDILHEPPPPAPALPTGHTPAVPVHSRRHWRRCVRRGGVSVGAAVLLGLGSGLRAADAAPPAPAPDAPPAPAPAVVAAEIAYLLDYVAKADCTFVRNGKEYDGKRAAEHLQAKRDHFKKEIKTAEDFIRLAATKSLQSDQPYLIRTKAGDELRCAAWLTGVLTAYRKARVAPPPADPPQTREPEK